MQTTATEKKAKKGECRGDAGHLHPGLSPTKLYLIAFNTVSTLLWARLLVLVVWFILTPRADAARWAHAPLLRRLEKHLSGSYDFHGLGEATKYTQTLAVMEVVHALLGLVRSPVGTVAGQVASRLWAVWGVVEMVPATHNNPLFTTMLLAWSVTEVIRYPFYVLSLLGKDVYFLNWLRYNTFLVLYPLGAGSEAFLSLSTLPPLDTLPYVPATLGQLHDLLHRLPAPMRQSLMRTAPGRKLLWNVARAKAAAAKTVRWTPIQYARLVLFFVWWPALYVLYTYMLGQRRKFFRKHSTSKTVAGVNKAR